ncbi:30S ribosomal protein S13 [Candidatus Woesearchaeota archaeon]|nr:30S ribosomal protein S13 [Candidatus Woesearchaeota archaeon]
MSNVKAEKEFKHVVRIANTDIDGRKHLVIGLKDIVGVGIPFANAVCAVLGLDKTMKTGYLSDEEVDKIEDVLKNPNKYGIPAWLYDRRKDLESGEDKHLVGVDLKLQWDADIRRLRKIKCYRGVRHALGLPVRGQRTKSNFRKNKGKALGVKKKKKGGRK